MRAQTFDEGRKVLDPIEVGRLPVVATLDELDEAALVSILVEPKNALIKQYRRLFEMEGVKLTFEQDALLAIIREPECIGCTKCIQACPVDAIIGGAKLMHTIIADLCTGCELCIPPCPMDCIDLIPLEDNRQEFYSA